MVGRVLFLAISSREDASSRLRAWNVADAWPDADCIQWDGTMPDLTGVGVVVLQKLWPSNAHTKGVDMPALLRQLKASGVRLIWDVCDPIWWWIPQAKSRLMLEPMDAITVSSPGLRDSLREDYGLEAIVIPDRLPYHTIVKDHWDSPSPGLVWFGYAQNRQPAFYSGRIALNRLVVDAVKFRLLLIDGDGGETGQADANTYVERVIWNRQCFDIDLLNGDVAFLPAYPGIVGRMKSNNKEMTASWAGLPFSTGEDYRYLHRCLTDWKFRAAEGLKARAWAEAEYEIGTSVEQWKALCSQWD